MQFAKERSEEMMLGFADTHREALVTRGRLEKPRNPYLRWYFEPPVIGAALVSGNDKHKVVWVCTEITNKDGGNKYLLGDTNLDFGRFTFRHVDCDNAEDVRIHQLCTACRRTKQQLFSRFDSNLQLHGLIHPHDWLDWCTICLIQP